MRQVDQSRKDRKGFTGEEDSGMWKGDRRIKRTNSQANVTGVLVESADPNLKGEQPCAARGEMGYTTSGCRPWRSGMGLNVEGQAQLSSL